MLEEVEVSRMEGETYPGPTMKFEMTNLMESVLRINLMLKRGEER